MSQVSVTVNGHPYKIACDDGQEPRIRRLAQYVDARVGEFVKNIGQVGEARLLLLTALVIADELSDTNEALAQETSRYRAAESEADEAWWPPTFSPSVLSRMWLAWWMVQEESHNTFRCRAERIASSVLSLGFPIFPSGLARNQGRSWRRLDRHGARLSPAKRTPGDRASVVMAFNDCADRMSTPSISPFKWSGPSRPAHHYLCATTRPLRRGEDDIASS